MTELKQACEKWLDLNGHDHLLMEERKKLNQLAPSSEVSAMIHQITEERKNENSILQSPDTAVSESRSELPSTTEPVTPEPSQGIQNSTPRLRSRVRESQGELPEGMTPSGTRKSGASGGKSIVDGIL